MEWKKITIFLGLCAAAINSVEGQAAIYGQPCDDDTNTNCALSNVLDPLECDPVRKVCRCPDNMFRHDELDRCVSPQNETCTLQSGDGSRIRSCTEFAQCWPNVDGNKNVDGKCHCDLDAKFDKDITGKCKLSHGSTRCKKETDCDIMSSLTCKEGTCVCLDEENQSFSDTDKKCITKAKGSCAKIEPYPSPECGKNMICNTTTNLCECDTNFEETPEGTCGKQHDASCEDSLECHPQFICNTDKKCDCREGQEYNQGSCRILVGGSCETNEPTFNCTLHASCINEECVCDADGYKEDPATKKCIALFGSACSEETPCSSDDFLECKADNTCQCKDNYESDADQKKCKGHIDQACRNNNDEDCVANSICSDGICSCSQGQIKHDDLKLCLALFGGFCSENTPCSDKHFISCTASTCTCANPEHQLPDEEAEGCVGKADYPCGEAGLGIPCVANSTCSGDPQVCRCDGGFMENEGECITDNRSGSSNVFSSWGTLLMFVTGALIMGKL